MFQNLQRLGLCPIPHYTAPGPLWLDFRGGPEKAQGKGWKKRNESGRGVRDLASNVQQI